MEPYELAEWFEEVWPHWPKDQVCYNIEHRTYGIAFETEGLQWLLLLKPGPRLKRFTETVFIVNPRATIITDRMVAARTFRPAKGGVFINIWTLLNRLPTACDPDDVCRRSLREAMHYVRKLFTSGPGLISLPVQQASRGCNISAATLKSAQLEQDPIY